jgi:hypothetical protein
MLAALGAIGLSTAYATGADWPVGTESDSAIACTMRRLVSGEI